MSKSPEEKRMNAIRTILNRNTHDFRFWFVPYQDRISAGNIFSKLSASGKEEILAEFSSKFDADFVRYFAKDRNP